MAKIVLYVVNVLVMWRVVVTTEADGPEPRVRVATLASTVVLTLTSSPVETVLVASAQSDQVSVMLGVELATTWTGDPGLEMVDSVTASTGELLDEPVGESQSPNVSELGFELDDDIVKASTSAIVVVVVVELLFM